MITPGQALENLGELDLDEEATELFLSGNARRIFSLCPHRGSTGSRPSGMRHAPASSDIVGAAQGNRVGMTFDENARQEGDALVGARAYADVELALKRLAANAAERGPSRQFASGVAAAYQWALGRAERSPVTGASRTLAVPDMQSLTAEVDAAVVLVEDPTLPPGPRDHSRGVLDALAWVCGHSEHRP